MVVMKSSREKIRSELASSKLVGVEKFTESLIRCDRARMVSIKAADDIGLGWIGKSGNVNNYDFMMEFIVQTQYIATWSRQISDMVLFIADKRLNFGHIESGDILLSEVWSSNERVKPIEMSINNFRSVWSQSMRIKAVSDADGAARELIAAIEVLK